MFANLLAGINIFSNKQRDISSLDSSIYTDDDKSCRAANKSSSSSTDVLSYKSVVDPYSGRRWFRFDCKFEVLNGSLSDKFRSHFVAYENGLIRSIPGNYVTFPDFAKSASEIYNFQTRKDDVFVCTFPKSGTTWMQELVWLLMNDCDFKGAKKSLTIRSPMLEMNSLVPIKMIRKFGQGTVEKFLSNKLHLPIVSKIIEYLDYLKVLDIIQPLSSFIASFFFGNMLPSLQHINSLPSPRVIKTHLPFYLLPPDLLETSKMVYVARNPKDVIVSYFHYHRLILFHNYVGDLETFAEYFLEDKVYSSPFFPHIIDAWNRRHHPNLHFVFYEDLKANLRGEIQKIAKFLGKRIDDSQLDKLTEHLRFDQFSKNEAVNYEFGKDFACMAPNGKFIRKGKTGDWKSHFSPELNARIDRWIQSNLTGTDLTFITELEQQD